MFDFFIKDSFRNSSGYFSGFSRIFCKSSIFRLSESLGPFWWVSLGGKLFWVIWKVFKNLDLKNSHFRSFFYVKNYETKLQEKIFFSMTHLFEKYIQFRPRNTLQTISESQRHKFRIFMKDLSQDFGFDKSVLEKQLEHLKKTLNPAIA